jgi:hypothetical protein
METSNEIRSIIKNIRYYTEKLQELTKIQFNKDFDTGTLLGINTGAGSTRFETVGAIHATAGRISLYCDNIEANLKSAETQDEKLRLPNEEKQEPEYSKEAVTQEEFR